MPPRWFKIHTLTRRIALAGTANAGKTVFLTALINHLAEHSPRQLPFGHGAEIRNFHELRDGAHGLETFAYKTHRAALANDRQWPEKTSAATWYGCSFDRTDWQWNHCRLEFLDFPGERIADALIAQRDDYADWSDQLLHALDSDRDYRETARVFLELADTRGPLEAEAVTRAYRRMLAEFIRACHRLVTPSTFFLDGAGRMPDPPDLDHMVETRYAGLPPTAEGRDRQFAPLSAAARAANPELARRFAADYTEYRAAIAEPLFRQLKLCDRLILLVDIATLLNGGHALLNDQYEVIGQLLDVLRNRRFFDWLLRRLPLAERFDVSQLERVAVVAAKSDIIHPRDVDNGRLEGLLREMTRGCAARMPNVDFRWFTCSAVVSTQPGEEDHELKGRQAYNNPGKELRRFRVPELPESWPDSWDPGQYSFPRVWPDVPAAKHRPPAHHGLDAVFDFITE